MEQDCLGFNSSNPMGVKTAHVRWTCYRRPLTKRITINVGGRKFIVKENVFEKFPYSLLGNLRKYSYYDKEKKEYFFDRDPDAFRYVLDYCRTGRLHVSDEECFTGLLDELDFFRIPTSDIYNCTCCEEETSFNIQQIIDKRIEQAQGKKHVKYIPQTTRQKVWEFFSNDEYSSAASLYSNVIHIITVLSVVLIAFETVSCDVNIKCGEAYEDIFFIANSICVAAFTVDYVVRLVCAPERLKFVRGFLNIVDLLALLPFYIAITLKYVFRIYDDFSFIAILRLFRVFRIIKLAKRSERLKTMGGSIFKDGGSGAEVFFVLFGLLMVLTVFSTIIFFMEQTNSETAFGSIPETMWYTAVTITSLGYGDMVPSTILGKFFGIMTLLVGFLGSSLLIPVVQMKFGSFSKKQL
ncbi:potassium voltage-gated channel protein Shal [Exaiptasia diaphana]|uniref:BTB domain-containing protein n=1 Tax=Exaiptasia diaphana TaxID=2652724 RepID=A0A913Y3P7_EXADI|nr:potassium voltage-gated channel protein Shal [Exaiptasia diaphana]KXJ23096.1 Potassium voltage-gated channel protein Shal [Exaiptasia diaphana]